MGLDLNVFVEKVWPLTLIGGEVLSIGKPPQKLMMKLVNLGKNPIFTGNAQDKDVEKVMDVIATLIVDIVNNNKEEKTFTKAKVNEMFTLDMQVAIVQGYTKFMDEVLDSPN